MSTKRISISKVKLVDNSWIHDSFIKGKIGTGKLCVVEQQAVSSFSILLIRTMLLACLACCLGSKYS